MYSESRKPITTFLPHYNWCTQDRNKKEWTWFVEYVPKTKLPRRKGDCVLRRTIMNHGMMWLTRLDLQNYASVLFDFLIRSFQNFISIKHLTFLSIKEMIFWSLFINLVEQNIVLSLTFYTFYIYVLLIYNLYIYIHNFIFVPFTVHQLNK